MTPTILPETTTTKANILNIVTTAEAVQPATPTRAHDEDEQTTTTMTKATLTTTTTTEMLLETLVVTLVDGSMNMDVEDPAKFKEDTVARNAVKEAIAELAGVPESYISLEVVLEDPQRRLRANARRLAAVQIDYTITIPPGSEANPDAVAMQLQEVPSSEVNNVVQAAVKKAKGADYKVSVTSVAPIEVKRITAPMTKLNGTMSEAITTTMHPNRDYYSESGETEANLAHSRPAMHQVVMLCKFRATSLELV